MPTDKPITISHDSRVTLALALTIAGVGWWIRSSITELSREVQQAKSEMFTTSRAAETALRLAIANPGMVVPDPRDPDSVIVVRSALIAPSTSTGTHP